MNRIKIALIISMAFFAIASCKKDTETKTEVPSIPTKFSEIKTDPSFNWQTSREVEIKLTGINTEIPISNTLVLSNKDKKAIYYTGNHLMSESLVIKITVPTAQDSMVLTFGSTQKTYGVQQKSVDVDYIISYPEE